MESTSLYVSNKYPVFAFGPRRIFMASGVPKMEILSRKLSTPIWHSIADLGTLGDGHVRANGYTCSSQNGGVKIISLGMSFFLRRQKRFYEKNVLRIIFTTKH